MAAWYNENDPFAAAWLRELINEGHIAPGVVDERDIRDVSPDELSGFAQCHFFAGIGVWSHALRRAGWPDDRPVWTGSCPCQPFSAAGGRAGFADERHLWPAFFHLIEQRRPGIVFGEQVASKDGLAWLDLVSADLEGADYAFGAVDLCAAGFGAPHIRQRLFWVADADEQGLERRAELSRGAGQRLARQGGLGRGLADANGGHSGAEWEQRGGEQRQLAPDGGIVRLADAERQRVRGERSAPAGSEASRVQGAHGERQRLRVDDRPGSAALAGRMPGPTNGLWRDADWLGCTDGKWRPVEPGTFPLADAGAFRNRVAELRGAGNAINLAQATGFIEAVIDHLAGRVEREAA